MLMNKSEDKCGVGINILSGYLSTFTIYIYIYIYMTTMFYFLINPKPPPNFYPPPHSYSMFYISKISTWTWTQSK
jgi:hypothetical protein